MFDKKTIQEYRIIETNASKLPEMTPDLRESLKALQYHPAFNYLVQKLRFHKGQVQTYLNEGFQLEDRELRYLQAGVYWLGVLDRELSVATQTPVTSFRSPSRQEINEFDKFSANLEMVGE